MDNKKSIRHSEANALEEAEKLNELVGDKATKKDYDEAEKIVDEESERRLKKFLEIEGPLLEFSNTFMVGDEGHFIEPPLEERAGYLNAIQNRDINGLHRLIHRMELWLYARRRNAKAEDYQKIDTLQKKLRDWLDGK